jgi:ABC-2 type transport system ATP-binding protein
MTVLQQDVIAAPFKPLSEAELGLPAIEIKGLSKRFMVQQDPPATVAGFFVNLLKRRRRERREFWALENVSLSIRTGETVGIVGPNGSGKSTLLKVMAGIYRQTYGEITIRRHLVPLLELGAGFHPELTGRENIYLNGALLGRTRPQMDAVYDAIVKFSGIGDFINTPLKFYSSGMKVRLGFSVAIHIDAEIMLLDEIFAVGDDNFQHKCIRRLRQFQAEGRTLVLVSHGMELINQLCDRAFWIQGGRLLAEGKASDVTAQYTAYARSHGEP